MNHSTILVHRKRARYEPRSFKKCCEEIDIGSVTLICAQIQSQMNSISVTSSILISSNNHNFNRSIFGVGEEAVNVWHDLGGFVADIFPQSVFLVLLPFGMVIQDASSSVFLGHPIFGKIKTYVNNLMIYVK